MNEYLPVSPDEIFQLTQEQQFNGLCLKIFHYQYQWNTVYKRFCDLLKIKKEKIIRYNQIPFLPIGFFKNFSVVTGTWEPEMIFGSSGTSGMSISRHYVRDTGIYKQSFILGFNNFYGDPAEYCILALLPSYLERQGSSLIFMVKELMDQSGHPLNGFFMYEHEMLAKKLLKLRDQKQKTILLGVSYALMDFAADYSFSFPELIIIETGGMKGKRKEIVREELHDIIKKSFGVPLVHSEYGMTELLSQAWSNGQGHFKTPPWMKVLIHDTNDPMSFLDTGKNGGISVIDLANIHSCSFIATSDLGHLYNDGTFGVSGRYDNSDIRGCNLMAEMV